jgi:hypothetical protein
MAQKITAPMSSGAQRIAALVITGLRYCFHGTLWNCAKFKGVLFGCAAIQIRTCPATRESAPTRRGSFRHFRIDANFSAEENARAARAARAAGTVTSAGGCTASPRR